MLIAALYNAPEMQQERSDLTMVVLCSYVVRNESCLINCLIILNDKNEVMRCPKSGVVNGNRFLLSFNPF